MLVHLGNNLDAVIDQASAFLDKGGVVAYPTETFYGLGVRFDNSTSLERLYALKRRQRDKAVPLIIGSTDQLSLITDSPTPAARLLMERFWPGPLTILFRALPTVNDFVAAEGKVAVRIPGESFALKLAQAYHCPITATSANRSGKPAASDAAAVIAYFGDHLDLVIDGGTAIFTVPSTIVDASGPCLRVLREGAIPISCLLDVDTAHPI